MGGASTGGSSSNSGSGGSDSGPADGGASSGGAGTGGSGAAASGGAASTACGLPSPPPATTAGDDGCTTPNGHFGLTTSTDLYTVDTGAGLVFAVRRTEPANNTQALGDIASLKWNGVEFQNQTRGSQVGVGIGGGTVTAKTYGADEIRIAVTAPDGVMTHYYIAKNGCSNVFMATYFETEPSLGNVRFITRIPYGNLPNGPAPSDLNGTTGAIEASDVFGLANGETRSKHYSNHRQMDWQWTGATGSNVGVFMVKGNEEGMSGGPFYRNLINQAGGDQEVYELINYGEAQTEPNRTKILNTYTLVFNHGSEPAAPDLSFLADLELIGYVPDSARGGVAGEGVSGCDPAFSYVIGFANATAQYWTVPQADGSYALDGMMAGTYVQTIFKGEYAVWTGNVTVSAGATTAIAAVDISQDPSTTATIFRIGDWDGTPLEFSNGSKLTYMHPQDVRMDDWGPKTFVVGANQPADFPAAQFRAANSPTTIQFTLTAEQAQSGHTLNLGTTIAYNNGRPQVTVNGHVLANPAAPNQPKTRSLTVGTYRGNNTTYSWAVPAADFVAGQNVITITPISGNTDLGTWLSASFSYDCVELTQ